MVEVVCLSVRRFLVFYTYENQMSCQGWREKDKSAKVRMAELKLKPSSTVIQMCVCVCFLLKTNHRQTRICQLSVHIQRAGF